MKKIAFRVDASTQIGIGHVMRCLTLANALRERGSEISFVTQRLPGDMNQHIKNNGYKVVSIDRIADLKQLDWLIIDHYGLDESWECKMRAWAKHIFVIDDLANRRHDCDILLDQNYYLEIYSRYEKLVKSNCKLLLGPQFVLLRPEFYAARNKARIRDGNVRRILIFFGGSDPTGETIKTLRALEKLRDFEFEIDVVVGSSNCQRQLVEKYCRQNPYCTFHCQISYMSDLIAVADLAIGAGGSNTWERCYLGLPALVFIVAENQSEITEAVHEYGAIYNAGWGCEATVENIALQVEQLLQRPERLVAMSKQAFALMGSDQVRSVERIVGIMEEYYAAKS